MHQAFRKSGQSEREAKQRLTPFLGARLVTNKSTGSIRPTLSLAIALCEKSTSNPFVLPSRRRTLLP